MLPISNAESVHAHLHAHVCSRGGLLVALCQLPALGGESSAKATACGRAMAVTGSSPEAPLPAVALHVTMATALGILGASGTLLLRIKAKQDRHTGCDHVSGVHFDRQPPAAAETIHPTQRATSAEAGAGVAPWKTTDSKHSLSGGAGGRARIVTWAFKVKKWTMLARSGKLAKPLRRGRPSSSADMGFLS